MKDYPSYLDYPKEHKTTTNADRIRAMTDEELAEFFSSTCCPNKFGGKGNCAVGCVECWLDWLRKEATS